MKLVFKRFVSVGEMLAKCWRSAADLRKLANVGPTLAQRRQSYHDDRKTNTNLEITNINKNM